MTLACLHKLSLLERKLDALHNSQRHSTLDDNDGGSVPATQLVRTPSPRLSQPRRVQRARLLRISLHSSSSFLFYFCLGTTLLPRRVLLRAMRLFGLVAFCDRHNKREAYMYSGRPRLCVSVTACVMMISILFYFSTACQKHETEHKTGQTENPKVI